MKTDPRGPSSPLSYVPENLKTQEICEAAMAQSPHALRYVPEQFKTAEYCHKAVQEDSRIFKYVPENYKTFELCLTAVQNDKFKVAIDYVPDELKAQVLEACKPQKKKKN